MCDFKGLFRAIAAIYEDNRALRRHLGAWWRYLVQGGKAPRGIPTVSVRLNCEHTTAHRLLEDLISELKAVGRGRLPRRPIVYWLALSSRQLLNELHALAGLQPEGRHAAADELRHAVDAAMSKEDALTNFLLCESGGGRHLDEETYARRLDGFLRDLKVCFNRICVAVEDIEVAIVRERIRRRAGQTPRPDARKPSAAETMMRQDRRTICREVRRRYGAKVGKGIKTSLRQELELLARDEGWARRVRQWRLATLYTYLVRERTGRREDPSDASPEVSPETSPETSPEISPETCGNGLSKGARQVMALIMSDDRITTQFMADQIKVSKRMVMNYIKELASVGLRHEGSTKKGRWVFG